MHVWFETDDMVARRAVFLASLVVASLLVPAVGLGAASVNGNPEIDLYAANNRVTPGAETTLGVTVLNTGEIDVGGQLPGAEQRVTTARGVTLRMRSGGAPVRVKTGTVVRR